MLRVVTQALRDRCSAQCPILNPTIECTGALLEFHISARYKSHHDTSLSYIEDALHRFHTFKVVCVLGPAGKEAKANANTLRTIT